MPKLKNHSGAKKRFHRTKKLHAKQYSHRCANRNHILTKKSTERKRRLRQGDRVHATDINRVTQMLPMK